METVLVICSIFAAVQADLVIRHEAPNDDPCFLNNSRDAVSNDTIQLLQQVLKKNQSANQDADLGNLYDGVITRLIPEVFGAVKVCSNQIGQEGFYFTLYYSQKSKICMVEMAKKKDINAFTTLIGNFLTDYLNHERKIHFGDFLKLRIGSVIFFSARDDSEKCMADTAQCFLKNSKDAKINDTIEILQRVHTNYTATGTYNLGQLYDIILERNEDIFRAVEGCNSALPSVGAVPKHLSRFDKDCLLEKLEKGDEDDFFDAIEDFTNSYSRHNQKLHLVYFTTFYRNYKGFFFQHASQCRKDEMCFLKNFKDAISNNTIELLQQELNKTNQDIDLGNLYDGVITGFIPEVLDALKGCPNQMRPEDFARYHSQKSKSCLVEMAKRKKHLSLFTNALKDFIARYKDNRKIYMWEFKSLRRTFTYFFFLLRNYEECKVATTKCFLEKTKDVQVNDNIEILKRALTNNTETGKTNLGQLYDITRQIGSEVLHAVEVCNTTTLPAGDLFDNSISMVDKDCVLEKVEERSKEYLFDAIDYFTKSYSRNNKELHLGYFATFYKDSLDLFIKYDFKCKKDEKLGMVGNLTGSTANGSTD